MRQIRLPRFLENRSLIRATGATASIALAIIIWAISVERNLVPPLVDLMQFRIRDVAGVPEARQSEPETRVVARMLPAESVRPERERPEPAELRENEATTEEGSGSVVSPQFEEPPKEREQESRARAPTPLATPLPTPEPEERPEPREEEAPATEEELPEREPTLRELKEESRVIAQAGAEALEEQMELPTIMVTVTRSNVRRLVSSGQGLLIAKFGEGDDIEYEVPLDREGKFSPQILGLDEKKEALLGENKLSLSRRTYGEFRELETQLMRRYARGEVFLQFCPTADLLLTIHRKNAGICRTNGIELAEANPEPIYVFGEFLPGERPVYVVTHLRRGLEEIAVTDPDRVRSQRYSR